MSLGWPEVLGRLTRRESLTEAEAEEVMGVVFAGDATPAQIGAFLTLLHAKGETVEEVTGLARAMVAAAVPCPLDVGRERASPVVDLVGTGGDRLASINVTTLAALITAGCGVPVCKHGNRAASSSVGTADVLEALGVAVEIGPEGVARCVREAGMGFCFAQRFHPAMRFVGPVRSEIGVPTVFNFLGPLTNPARIRHQLVGVSDPAMAPDHGRGLRCHRQPAYPHRPRRRRPRRAERDLADVGDRSARRCRGLGRLRSVRVGASTRPPWGSLPRPWPTCAAATPRSTPASSASVLEGEPGARRDIGLLNASAALVVAGRVEDLGSGLGVAAESIDSGRALGVLDALVATSQDELRRQTG